MDILDEKIDVYKTLENLKEFVKCVNLDDNVCITLHNHIDVIETHLDIMLLKVCSELEKKYFRNM